MYRFEVAERLFSVQHLTEVYAVLTEHVEDVGAFQFETEQERRRSRQVRMACGARRSNIGIDRILFSDGLGELLDPAAFHDDFDRGVGSLQDGGIERHQETFS